MSTQYFSNVYDYEDENSLLALRWQSKDDGCGECFEKKNFESEENSRLPSSGEWDCKV